VAVLRFKADGTLDGRSMAAAMATLAQSRRARAKAELRAYWEDLRGRGDSGRGAPRRWRESRGYDLEALVLALASLERLSAQSPFSSLGEQLDGAMTVGPRTLLLEAKWREKRTQAADIYAFQGKVRGKLLGTLGLFVSVGGFTAAARQAIVHGKHLDILLADGNDVALALEPDRSLRELVLVKMTAATLLGVPDYAYQRWIDQPWFQLT
jgi:hypothetical protein